MNKCAYGRFFAPFFCMCETHTQRLFNYFNSGGVNEKKSAEFRDLIKGG